MKTTIFERLQKVYELTGTNANSLAVLLKISKSIVYNLDKQATEEPSVKMLQGLEKYADISMLWFLNEEGPIKASERNQGSAEAPNSWKQEKALLLELIKEKDNAIREKEFMANLFKIEKMKDPAVASFIKLNSKYGRVMPMWPNGGVAGVASGVGLV